MKLDLNFFALDQQWKERQLDLFPWFDGLFALLRTKEATLKETEKKLANSTLATKIQFLSSDDKNNYHIAKKILYQEQPESVLPMLIYSLEKVYKKDYSHRILDILLNFDPTISFGYLLGYLNLKQTQKEKVFQIITAIFANFKERFKNEEDRTEFIEKLFKALENDLRDRIPGSKKINDINIFEEISLDLDFMRLIFNKTNRSDDVKTVEKFMIQIGKDVIISLSNIPYEFKKGHLQVDQFIDILKYMALMRIKPDMPFLKSIPIKIMDSDLSQGVKDEITRTAEVVIKIIENTEKTIQETLDEVDIPYGFLND